MDLVGRPYGDAADSIATWTLRELRAACEYRDVDEQQRASRAAGATSVPHLHSLHCVRSSSGEIGRGVQPAKMAEYIYVLTNGA